MTRPLARSSLRLLLWSFALSSTGCGDPDPAPADETDDTAAGSGGGPSTGGSVGDATGETSADTGAADTVAETGDSGPDPVALPDGVFFFVREQGNGDALWAYDVETDESAEVAPLDGVAEISSVSIHPSRAIVAIASDYGTVDHQASEAIYAFEVHDDLVFDEPTLLMPAIPKPAGGVAAGYNQQIDDLRWHPDGAWLWFGHAFQVDFTVPGGGALGGVDPSTGELTLFSDAVGDCSVNTGASPSPDGSVLLAIQAVCIDDAHEGIVAFDGAPAGEPVVLVPTSNSIFTTPRWTPDAAGIVYAATIDFDSDGDGTNDVYGDALVLLEIETGMQYAVLAPTPGANIWEFTMAPAADRFVVCISQDGGRNLLLVDYTSDTPSTRWLTDDGLSCKPSW